MWRALCAAATIVGGTALAAHPLVDPKVYVGKDGARAVVAWLKPVSDDRCVVLVTGSPADFSGLVLDCTVSSNSSDDTMFFVTRKGRRREVLTTRRDGTAVTTGRRGFLELTYDDVASQKLDLEALWQKHQAQSPELKEYTRFDRAAEVSDGRERLAAATTSLNQACGGRLTASADWSKASDEAFKSAPFFGACVAALDQMRMLCQGWRSARAWIPAQVTTVRCLYGPQANDVTAEFDGTTLVITSSESSFSGDVTAFLKNMPPRADDAGRRTEALVPPRWGELKTLGQQMELEAARVCSDGKGHVVVVAAQWDLYSGDEKSLVAMRFKPGSTLLFDPRQRDGISEVVADSSRNACLVTCGQRQVSLPMLEAAAAEQLLRAAKFAPNPHQREPHALLRDAAGTYYYVDRGRSVGEEKSFRLFVGPKGALVLQKMTNVVSDSAGDIFSTRSGDLRLLIDREKTSEWVRSGKRTPLRLVPVAENLNVIYAELGVYAGERLGTPCDDL